MLPGWLLEAVGNGGPRGMAVTPAGAIGQGNRTRLMARFGQFIYPMRGRNDPPPRHSDENMNDSEAWHRGVERVAAAFGKLPPASRQAIGKIAAAMVADKERMHSLLSGPQGESTCGDCGGACCRSGKYHVSVADVLVYHALERSLFLPDFHSGGCPFLAPDGCVMPPGFRPFSCITFACDALEDEVGEQRADEARQCESALRAHYRAIGGIIASDGMKPVLSLGEHPEGARGNGHRHQ